ncbi:MAG: peptidase M28, partial [Bacteroidia bacterium]|nr:peptidase M28 [Bacteroidia bacterium]
MKHLFLSMFLFGTILTCAQSDPKIYDIIDAVSEERLKNDVKILVDFGTRHTLSDTLSKTRGIGAARRWIKSEFETISKDCNNCLDVFYQSNLIEKGTNQRIVNDVMVVNVVAIQRGTKYPNRFIIMSGDIDSRVSDPTDFTSESPGA